VGVRRPELELGRLEIEDRRKGVFTLAVLLGDPTANIPFDHVLRMPEPWARVVGSYELFRNGREAGSAPMMRPVPLQNAQCGETQSPSRHETS
jgi:hypothetical protein